MLTFTRAGALLIAALCHTQPCSAEPRAASAQPTENQQSLWQDLSDTASPPDFGALNARRKRLESEAADTAKKREGAVIAREKAEFEVRRLSNELAGTEARARSTESFLAGLSSSQAPARFALERSQTKATLDELLGRIEKLKADLAVARGQLPKAIELEAQLDARLAALRSELDATERRIADVLNLDASKLRWRTLVAVIFCVLLAYLIYRFFQTSDRDDVVRRSVFSEHAGIQFVTLFCLVIAIVLFGIIGVLEGKELSALLGGLSGYILGRANGRKPTPTVGSPDPAGRPPVPLAGAAVP
jgi:hypothetical protein